VEMSTAKEKFLRRFYRMNHNAYVQVPGQTVRERATTLKIMRHLKDRARTRGWTAADVQAARN
jgi:hypothetical protein